MGNLLYCDTQKPEVVQSTDKQRRTLVSSFLSKSLSFFSSFFWNCFSSCSSSSSPCSCSCFSHETLTCSLGSSSYACQEIETWIWICPCPLCCLQGRACHSSFHPLRDSSLACSSAPERAEVQKGCRVQRLKKDPDF